MDNERDNRVIWMFENDEDLRSVSELARACGVSTREVYKILNGAGYGSNAAEYRYYEYSVLKKLGIDNIDGASRCIRCEILLIDKGNELPEGWSLKINGRVGDLCASCAEEMKAEDKLRFEELVRIGCIVCLLEYGTYVAPEIHHIRRLGGYRNHKKTIPLCPDHHRTGGHGVARHDGLQEWEKRHGTEKELLSQVNLLCGEVDVSF